MRLAFAVLFLWLGASMLYFASRDLEATTPWAAFSSVMGKIRAAGEGD